MVPLADIPYLATADERVRAVLEFFGPLPPYDEPCAFAKYFMATMELPFAAVWKHKDTVSTLTVGHVHDWDDEAAERLDLFTFVDVVLHVEWNSRNRFVNTLEVWASDPNGVNELVLDDYRHWHKYFWNPLQYY